MLNRQNNYAFIDLANLHFALKSLGWNMDYRRFRVYLKERYGVNVAYMFVGFLFGNQTMYKALQSDGYIMVFKPVLETPEGKVKGNCDAELVLQAMMDFSKYQQAILITGDGDFYCLAKYLDEQNKLYRVLAPSTHNCSSLLKKIVGKKIAFLSDLKQKLAYKKRTL